MSLFGNKAKKEEKEERPQKSVSYYAENIGMGTSSEYAEKMNEIRSIQSKDNEGISTNTTSSEACGPTLGALGLPSGISYFAQIRKLIITEKARNEVEGNPELEKKFRKALGIEEGQKIPYKERS
jgi:hypothetical protein